MSKTSEAQQLHPAIGNNHKARYTLSPVSTAREHGCQKNDTRVHGPEHG